MKNLSLKDWSSAVFIFVIGLAAILGSGSYGIGTLSRMGTGYFPRLLGILMVMASILMLVGPKGDEVKLQGCCKGRWRAWSCTVLGMLIFVLVGQYGGFVPAVFALIFISAFGDHNNTAKENFILAICVTIATVGIFHYGLQLQFPLFVWG